MTTYARADLAFERGEGAYLYATDGRALPRLRLRRRGHGAGPCAPASGGGADGAGRTSCGIRPTCTASRSRSAWPTGWWRTRFADTAFFCNSGAEAVEAGIKLCRKYHDDNGHPERYRIITFEGNFHGRTLATISAGDNATHRKGFEPIVDGFDPVAFGNLNEVRNAVGDRHRRDPGRAGAGRGRHPPRRSRTSSKGCARCATSSACCCSSTRCRPASAAPASCSATSMVRRSTPDVMAIAKALGGGFPCGACLATADVAKSFVPGTHGSTFGGNPLAMAVANAVLDVMLADGFLDARGEMGDTLLARARAAGGEASQGDRGGARAWADDRAQMRRCRTPSSTTRCAATGCSPCWPATTWCGCCRR